MQWLLACEHLHSRLFHGLSDESDYLVVAESHRKLKEVATAASGIQDLAVQRGAASQQLLDDWDVAIAHSQCQGREAVFRDGVHLRLFLQQQLHRWQLPAARRCEEAHAAGHIGCGIHIDFHSVVPQHLRDLGHISSRASLAELVLGRTSRAIVLPSRSTDTKAEATAGLLAGSVFMLISRLAFADD